MKKNKKGFTLIELLAVIIILGVLMIIAIPSVTTYIQNSRKSAFIDTAINYIDAVKNKVNEQKILKANNPSYIYLVPVGNQKYQSCVSLESGGESPFDSKWVYAYVAVTYDINNGYTYYFAAEDGSNQGVLFQDRTDLQNAGTDALVYFEASSSDFNPSAQNIVDRYGPKDGRALKDQYLSTLYAIDANKNPTNDKTELQKLDKIIDYSGANSAQLEILKSLSTVAGRTQIWVFSSYYCQNPHDKTMDYDLIYTGKSSN